MSFTKEEIVEVFKAFDKDNSGQVSSSELVDLLSKLFKDDKEKAQQAADFIMKSFDTDKSGQLSMEEFITGTQKFLNQ